MGKMKGILRIAIVTAVLFMFASSAQPQAAMKQEEVLKKAIASSEAKVSKSMITLIARHKSTKFDKNAIEIRLNEILEAINPDQKSIVRNIIQDNDKIRANALCTKTNLVYNIIMEALGEESYEIMDIILNEDIDRIVSQKQLLENIYKEEWENSSVGMTTVGFYEGRLPNHILNKRIDTILESLQGKKVEELQEEDLISVSAYSKTIEGGIKSGDKKVNIQIAARYSSFDHKTYIWIGTPLINVEY